MWVYASVLYFAGLRGFVYPAVFLLVKLQRGCESLRESEIYNTGMNTAVLVALTLLLLS